MSRALLLIDLQKEYSAEGKLPLAGIDDALAQVDVLIGYFRTNCSPIVFVQHIALDPSPDAVFAQGSTGIQLHGTLRPEPQDALVAKYFPNAFYQSWLDARLKAHGVTDLVIAGAMTQTCIDSTARSALDFGYSVTIASDACIAGALEWEGETLAADQVHKTFLAALAALTPVKTVAEIVAHEVER